MSNRREDKHLKGIHRFLTGNAVAFLLLLVLFAGTEMLQATPAFAGPVRRPAGYNVNTMARGDNNSTALVTIPFQVRFFNSKYTQGYINTNGSMSFRTTNAVFDPSATFASLRDDFYAPFWADVDTTVGGTVTYSSSTAPPQVDGHNAFIVTWDGVGYHSSHIDKTNIFQLVLIDRSDTGAGNYDIEFNYDQIQWDRATDPVASVGYARSGIAQRSPATGWELPGSGIAGSQLDSGANALITHSQSTPVLGRYIWQNRGTTTVIPPTINLAFQNKTLEGNSKVPSAGYSGYSGAADASAVVNQPYATLASLVRSPATGSYLPLGDNIVTWTATDSVGGVTTLTQTITVVDTTAPTLPTAVSSSTHSPSVWSKLTNMIIGWTNDVVDLCTGFNGYSYSWSQDTGATPPATINAGIGVVSNSTALGEGKWYFNLRTVDVAGNWSVAKNTGPFWIDLTAPVTGSNISAGWVNTAPTVTLTASDLLSGNSSTMFRIDGGVWTSYTAPFLYSTDGTHTFEFYSTDGVGNVEATKMSTLRLDRALPTIPTGLNAAVAGSSVSLSWNAATDALSGIKEYRIYRGGSLVGTSSVTTFADTAPSDGSYSYTVLAVDAAGNASSQSLPKTVMADTTPPSLPTLTSPNRPLLNHWYGASSVTLNWTGSTDSLSGVAGYSYSYTVNVASLPDTAPDTFIPGTPNNAVVSPGDGKWHFNIRAVDGSGNWTVGAADLGQIWIDALTPTTDSNIAGGWTNTVPTVTLNATDTESGVATTMVRIDGGTYNLYTTPFAYATDGTHIFDFYSTDNVGNNETAKSATLRLDRMPPTTPQNFDGFATSNTKVTLTWDAATDALSGIGGYRIYRDGSLIDTVATPGYMDTVVGGVTYQYYVIAVDGAGNVASQTPPVSISVPLNGSFGLSVNSPNVDMGSGTPGNSVSKNGALTVTISGSGIQNYTLSTAGLDFQNQDAASPTPTMPIGVLQYRTNGQTTLPFRSFINGNQNINTADSTVAGVWSHYYDFDFQLDIPWNNEAGVYQTVITYTVIGN